MTRVAVIGAKGRMGSVACETIRSAEGLELVAEVGREDPLETVVSAQAEVAVELSTPSSVAENTRFCVEHGITTVVGATGLGKETVEELGSIAQEKGTGLLVVPNFALGAVLMMRFASLAAPYFEWAEIVERHHEKKVDSPSGTALRTAEMMDIGSGPSGKPDPGDARGLEVNGINVHSLRLPGSVAHQEVLLGAPGEILSIKHDSIDRSSFMPGLLIAIRKAPALRGAVVGLEHVLEL